MNFFKILAFGIILSVQSSFADQAGNGSGPVEAQIAYAYRNLEDFIRVPLANRKAELTDRDVFVLNDILRTIADERVGGLEDVKPANVPPDMKSRIFWTYLYKGAPIFINTDLLYFTDPTDDKIHPSIELPRIIGLLSHEFGHHVIEPGKKTGIEDEDFLQNLGAKVESAVLETRTEVPLPGKKDIIATILPNSEARSFDRFTLRTSKNFLDVSKLLTQRLTCREEFSYSEPIGIHLSNAHWLSPFSSSYFEETNTTQSEGLLKKGDRFQAIQMQAEVVCANPNNPKTESVDTDFQIVLSFNLNQPFPLFEKDQPLGNSEITLMKNTILDCSQRNEHCH